MLLVSIDQELIEDTHLGSSSKDQREDLLVSRCAKAVGNGQVRQDTTEWFCSNLSRALQFKIAITVVKDCRRAPGQRLENDFLTSNVRKMGLPRS